MAGDVRNPGDFDRVFQTATKERADALIALDDAFLFTHRTRIVKLAAKSRLPAIYENFLAVDQGGGLMTYGASILDLERRAATYVDKILNGAKPADFPYRAADEV